MAGSIGGISVDLFFGTVASLKTRSDVYEVFGQTGYGIQTGGGADGQFQVTTVYYATSEVDSSNHIADCEALQGTTVTIYDAFGESFTDCYIYHVDTADCQKAVIYGNNADAVRTEIKWQCLRVA